MNVNSSPCFIKHCLFQFLFLFSLAHPSLSAEGERVPMSFAGEEYFFVGLLLLDRSLSPSHTLMETQKLGWVTWEYLVVTDLVYAGTGEF